MYISAGPLVRHTAVRCKGPKHLKPFKLTSKQTTQDNNFQTISQNLDFCWSLPPSMLSPSSTKSKKKSSIRTFTNTCRFFKWQK